MLPQHLGDGEHEIGGGNAFAEFTAQFKAHHIRDQHRDRLAQHRGFRLNTADAPAQYAQAVDHRGMRIGTDQRIGPGNPFAVLLFTPDRFAKVFEVNLVANTGTRRHDAEAAERLLSPAQENVALMVTFHLKAHVFLKRIVIAEAIDGDRMVDNQVHRRQRVNLRRIASQPFDRLTHCRKIHHRGHAGKILHQHARRTIGNFPVSMSMFKPACQRMNIFGGDRVTVLPAQQILQQDFKRFGQTGQIAQFFSGQR